VSSWNADLDAETRTKRADDQIAARMAMALDAAELGAKTPDARTLVARAMRCAELCSQASEYVNEYSSFEPAQRAKTLIRTTFEQCAANLERELAAALEVERAREVERPAAALDPALFAGLVAAARKPKKKAAKKRAR
jgi:hypothetical protein